MSALPLTAKTLDSSVSKAKYWGQSLKTEPITSSIKIATPSDQDDAIAALILAFSADPAVRWMYPNPHQYLTYFPQFVRAFGGRAFEQGTAYCIDGYTGVALWFPPECEPDELNVVELLQRSIPNSHQADVFAVFKQMEHYHPSEPHWYLPLMGVEPTRQGKGYGSALLEHVLTQCDRDRTIAYLESSNPTNLALYKRHGFELLSTIQVGTSPPIFPMLRKPH